MCAWDGSGNFNRSDGVRTGTDVYAQQRTAGLNVDADLLDTHDQDIADGLENCITRDGQNSPSADLPMNSQKHTGVGNGSALTDYAAVNQVQKASLQFGGNAGGSANALTATLTPTPSALVDGQMVVVKITADNTGSATLNVNSLGANTIYKFDGNTALTGGELQNGQFALFIRNETGNRWQLVGPEEFHASTALAADDFVRVDSSNTNLFVGRSAAEVRSDISAAQGGTEASWTPTISANTGTVSIDNIHEARYQRIGDYIHFSLCIDWDTDSGSPTIIKFSEPVAGTTHNVNCAFIAAGEEAGTAVETRWRYDGADILVFQAGLPAWTGTGHLIHVQGFYRV